MLSIKMPDPKFSSQTKEKLVSSEVESVVSTVFSKYFNEYLLENPKDALNIFSKVAEAALARNALAPVNGTSPRNAAHWLGTMRRAVSARARGSRS